MSNGFGPHDDYLQTSFRQSELNGKILEALEHLRHAVDGLEEAKAPIRLLTGLISELGDLRSSLDQSHKDMLAIKGDAVARAGEAVQQRLEDLNLLQVPLELHKIHTMLEGLKVKAGLWGMLAAAIPAAAAVVYTLLRD